MFQKYFDYDNNLTISGLNEALINEYIINYFNLNDDNILIVTNSLFEANNIYKGIHNILNNVYLFPMDEFASFLAISASPDLKIVRIDTLNKIKTGKNIVVTNLTGFLKNIDKEIKTLNVDKSITRSNLLSFLENTSYKKTNLVTTTGEYAVRNYIIDVYSINCEKPIRFEFFGEEIDSIRYFDEESQISTNKLDNALLYSFSDNSNLNYENIYEKLGNPKVFFLDYKNIVKSYNDFVTESNILDDIKYKRVFNTFNSNNIVKINFINTIDDIAVEDNIKIYRSRDLVNFNNNYDNLKKYVFEKKDDYYICFMVSNDILINKLIKLFGNDISFNSLDKKRINVYKRSIVKGFIFKDYIVISEFDIENIEKKSNFINHYKIGRKIKGFEDLKKGDYVVHVMHGIGQYNGLVTLDNHGIKKDYLLINYAGNDKIYVPAQKIETIFKYSDPDVINIRLNSLSTNTWEKTKLKVRNKIKDISQELIKLYAEREMIKGEAYIDFPDELIFASDFEYEETKDQNKCIDEILSDLKKEKPMDRLLCGDVGFGKTEVAMRAMFKTVLNNRQVAYLCPTTILSKQQYKNCIKRFRHFPINIELLNRFTSSKDVNRIILGLEKGSIDIVIGTHKILNSSIKFKHLGLLVIDEEQRFGVSQKEKIKQLKNNVNVLSLSATPIPRTLKLAVSGIKDLSVIDTAPINRYPVQTYVIEDNDYLLKEAIYKEISRNGQVYLLLNNIDKLSDEFDKIKKLVPEARISIAHGRMEKNTLNQIIGDFVEGKFDVLLCTTIIETGIDIPNVNTLIIKNADTFGLSQLYQIRGRVGRSDRIAYAYMMYRKDKFLNDIAIKRLKTIKDFTELGSGYKIAMRDLSIRGAGELLGSSQAGFVDSVGIDLYMSMINDEILRIKGVEIKEEEINSNNLLDITTHISENYVDDESIRIEIHKLINEINSKESFDKVKNEIEDRFGKISNDVLNYMYEEWFQNEADKLGIKNIKYINNIVELELPETISSFIDGEKLFFQIYNINPKFKIRYFNKMIYISLNIVNRNGDYVKDLLELLLLIKNCIKNI